MVVPAVHKHCVQDVVGGVLGVWLLKELVQRQLIWKLKPIEERAGGRSGEVRQENDGDEREEPLIGRQRKGKWKSRTRGQGGTDWRKWKIQT